MLLILSVRALSLISALPTSDHSHNINKTIVEQLSAEKLPYLYGVNSLLDCLGQLCNVAISGVVNCTNKRGMEIETWPLIVS
jgi:hypothetical protein